MNSHSVEKCLVSFVIPHHGREHLLLQTIESILAQDVDHKRVEVVIVSKSTFQETDTLPAKLASAGFASRVKFYSIPQDRTISYGRNHGADKSSGEYLAFIDADVRLAPDWVSTMIRLLQSNVESVLVAGVQVPDAVNNTIDVIKSSMSRANTGEVLALPGNALFIHRDKFNESDKFPEHLETCEDWVFSNSLTNRGKVLLTDESSFVHLGEDQSFLAMFRKEIWRGKSNLGSLPGRKIDLAELPSIFVPVVVLFSVVLVVPFLLLGLQGLALLSAIFALVAPLLYSIRLKLKSGVRLNMFSLISFYTVYFVARAIGMITGFFEKRQATQSA